MMVPGSSIGKAAATDIRLTAAGLEAGPDLHGISPPLVDAARFREHIRAAAANTDPV